MMVRSAALATSPRRSGGLICGLIRLRSSAFNGVQISAAMPVTNVGGAWRTRILSPENRKVGGSTPPLATTSHRPQQPVLTIFSPFFLSNYLSLSPAYTRPMARRKQAPKDLARSCQRGPGNGATPIW
jgi:hypothetical protein